MYNGGINHCIENAELFITRIIMNLIFVGGYSYGDQKYSPFLFNTFSRVIFFNHDKYIGRRSDCS